VEREEQARRVVAPYTIGLVVFFFCVAGQLIIRR
jgi:hypothetical protein